MAGHTVILGSRDSSRAADAAARYADVGEVSGAGNAEAAGAELVIVAVPYAGHAGLLASLATELAGRERIRGFGIYNAVAAAAGSVGALAAGGPGLLRRRQDRRRLRQPTGVRPAGPLPVAGGGGVRR